MRCVNNKHKKSDPNSNLYRAMLQLRTVEECYAFFEDLCTVAELQAMEQRFEVAALLNDGLIYNDILEKTGVSSATISRVNRCLNYGNDSYRTLLARLKELDQEQEP
ncbi:MAG: TrpR-like protein [Oscillospiraceae bacterium]|nr:TrpR-like protein [Oscillospiraceae bacterium]